MITIELKQAVFSSFRGSHVSLIKLTESDILEDILNADLCKFRLFCTVSLVSFLTPLEPVIVGVSWVFGLNEVLFADSVVGWYGHDADSNLLLGYPGKLVIWNAIQVVCEGLQFSTTT